MSRISPLPVEQASGKTADLFAAIKTKLGMVPNMMKTMGKNPAVLEAYLGFSGTLAKGALTSAQREQIALSVGESNDCGYCVSAHSLLGKHAGLAPDAVLSARRAQASHPKTQAILTLAIAINKKQGHLSDEDLTAARNAGVSDEEIAEVVANVALNIFTNYFNHVAATDIDFPLAPKL